MSYFSNGDGEFRDPFEHEFWEKGIGLGFAALRERVGAHASFEQQHEAIRGIWVSALHKILQHRGWCRCVYPTDPCWTRIHQDAQTTETFGTQVAFGAFMSRVLDRIVRTAGVTGTPVFADESVPRVRPMDKDGHIV